MNTIRYISEKSAKGLIETEIKLNDKNKFIVNPHEFSNHCIDTGRIAYEVANNILIKHPSLKDLIDPDIVRVEGYVHDFSKIYEGNK